MTDEKVIITPDNAEAEYVYTNSYGDPVYYDGYDYWVKLKDGSIEFYE